MDVEYLIRSLDGVELTRDEADRLIAKIQTRVVALSLREGFMYLDQSGNGWVARKNDEHRIGVTPIAGLLNDEKPRVLVRGDRSFPIGLVPAVVQRWQEQDDDPDSDDESDQ